MLLSSLAAEVRRGLVMFRERVSVLQMEARDVLDSWAFGMVLVRREQVGSLKGRTAEVVEGRRNNSYLIQRNVTQGTREI